MSAYKATHPHIVWPYRGRPVWSYFELDQDQVKSNRRTSPPPGVKSPHAQPPPQTQPVLQTPPTTASSAPKAPVVEKTAPSQPPGLAQPVHQKEVPSGPTSPVSGGPVQPDQVRSPPAQQKEADKITQSKLNVNAKEFTPFAPKVQPVQVGWPR